MDNTREIDACREALRLAPEDTVMLYTLAVAYASSGNMTEAWELQERLDRIDPSGALHLSADIREFAR
jgi:cytochrome c-type biogenesis protein CcmH/NrfG